MSISTTNGGPPTAATAVLPLSQAQGGTGKTTLTGVRKAFSIFPLAANVPVGGTDAAAYAGQIGISPNNYWWVANSTAAGDWVGQGIVFVGGFPIIADPKYSDPNSAFASVKWYFNGAPNRQISTITGDGNLILINCNPYGSGSGISLGYVGKTNQGPLLCTNSNAENIYLHDQFAASFLITPENGSPFNNPGAVSVLSNGGRLINIATTFNPTGTTCNYPWYTADPRTSPYKSYFAKFVDQKLDPTTGGWVSAMIIDHTAGNVSIPGLLLMGSGAQQITTAAGKLNLAAFDNTQTGTMDISAASLNVNKILTVGPYATIAAGPLSLALQGSGIGFNWDSANALLGCGWQGTTIWTVGGATGPFNFFVDVAAKAAGSGFRVKEGANCRMGVAVLVAGTVTVANTSVTANTRIFLSRSTTGGAVGHLSTTQIAGTSFTINASVGTDTSTINWELKEPA